MNIQYSICSKSLDALASTRRSTTVMLESQLPKFWNYYYKVTSLDHALNWQSTSDEVEVDALCFFEQETLQRFSNLSKSFGTSGSTIKRMSYYVAFFTLIPSGARFGGTAWSPV
ncbi:hypothetical protein Zmor_010173 [Zophobas morio]|uniref:Uncharacterized protein n=1 Tax=Zophobas morio TaxID=2755281 RepID=A0AA38IIC0_9CUCU|nr:hypothetical protein Zmor_010173 [Zophobas morio]